MKQDDDDFKWLFETACKAFVCSLDDDDDVMWAMLHSAVFFPTRSFQFF